MLFNKKKKCEKYLSDRQARIDQLDIEQLKSEPFVLKPTERFPMLTQISVYGEVVSGMYQYGDPIGMTSKEQVIHSKDFEMRIPGMNIENEELGAIYKGDVIEFIFTDVMAKLVDEDSDVVADPWNEIHKGE